jgi:hypothetical protein
MTDVIVTQQPAQPPWNRHGHGNNAVHRLLVRAHRELTGSE